MISAAGSEDKGIEMKLARFGVLAVVVVALAGCGGSDEQTVNGCVIQPDTGCANIDLSGADLEGADLSGADLSGTNLTDANLSGASLVETNLSGSQIVDADLSDADLTRANLSGATITNTDFTGAILCGTTRTDGTTDDSGCPATTDTTDTETTVVPSDTAAEVTSFELSELDCGAATTGPVTITWETENATAVAVALDTAAAASFPPSGSTTVVVPCDGQPHAVTITPQSDTGPGVPETKEIEEAS